MRLAAALSAVGTTAATPVTRALPLSRQRWHAFSDTASPDYTDAGVAHAEHTTTAREEWLARALQDRLTEDERRVVRNAMALLNRLAEPDSATTH